PPSDAVQLANCEPIYEEVRSWNSSTHSARRLSQLPLAAREYVRYISKLTRARLSVISVGQERSEPSIIYQHPNVKTAPRHIAIIMNGNGRWTKTRGSQRVRGPEA